MIIINRKTKIKHFFNGKRKVKFQDQEFWVTKKYAKALQKDLDNLTLVTGLMGHHFDLHFSVESNYYNNNVTTNRLTIFIVENNRFVNDFSLELNDFNVLKRIMYRYKPYTFFDVPIKRLIEEL